MHNTLNIRYLKIRPRLMSGFAIFGLVLCVACAWSLFEMSRVEFDASDIKDNWLPAVNAVGQMDLRVEAIRRNTLYVRISDNQADRDARLVLHDKSIAELKELENEYEQLADPGEDRRMYEEDKVVVDKFIELDNALAHQVVAADADPQVTRSNSAANQQAFYDASRTLGKHLAWLNAKVANSGAHAHETYKTAMASTLIVIALALVLAVFVANYITNSIIRPINRAIKLLDTIARGDLVGAQTETNTYPTELGQLIRSSVLMCKHLKELVSQVRTSADVVLNGSSEIAAGNENLSQRTEEQAASVEQTVASVQHLTNIVQSNAESARQGMKLAQSTSQLASQGGQVMSNVIETMTGISTQSQKVADIINTIEGIAFQTNILALNAAVEAARAGNEGRGFAVVAQEVRTLAQRSAVAAKEIKELVSDSVNQVNSGSTLVNSAGSAIDSMVREFQHVSDLMNEITSASAEGHEGILEVNKAIGEIDTVTQHNAALVEQAAAASRNVHDEAQRLRDLVATFKID